MLLLVFQTLSIMGSILSEKKKYRMIDRNVHFGSKSFATSIEVRFRLQMQEHIVATGHSMQEIIKTMLVIISI